MKTSAARASDRKGDGPGPSLTQLREVQDIIRDRRVREGPFSFEDQMPALAVVARRLYCVLYRKTGKRPAENTLISEVRFWAVPMGRGHMPEASPMAIRAAVIAALRVIPATDTAENAGEALKLTYEARRRLDIRTVWACDVAPEERPRLALERKRERDRMAAKARRAAKGAKPRVMLGENREWEALGISRRTFQRRRKAYAAAVSSPVSPNVVSLLRKKEEVRKSDRKGSHSEESVSARTRDPHPPYGPHLDESLECSGAPATMESPARGGAGGREISFRPYATASLAAFTGRALMSLRAGFALKTVGSFVKGFIPWRAFVAGFLITMNLASPAGRSLPALITFITRLSRYDEMLYPPIVLHFVDLMCHFLVT
jgi:hypothetical protein